MHAHNHTVGLHEIINRGTLTQKLGVRGHIEFRIRIGLGDDLLDLAVCAHRNRRFGHHNGIAVNRMGNLFGSREHIGQIGMAIATTRWRTDRNKHRIGVAHGLRQIQRERQATRLNILGHQLGQPRLINRNLPGLQLSDLVCVLVDTDNLMPEVRETNTRDKANIAGSDHCDLHLEIRPTK